MVEVDGYSLADALRLHSHAVKHIRNTHRSLGVRDYDELGFLLEFPDNGVKTLVVGLIEGGVNFVQEAERGRFCVGCCQATGD